MPEAPASMPTTTPASQIPPALRTVEAHLAAVLEGIVALPARRVPLMEALDLTCAERVRAPGPLPRFANSAMDGYAVRRVDVASATEASPVVLPVIGEIGAGQVGVTELPAGTVAKIMTGAPVPTGCDAVVPYEWTDHGAERVRIVEAPTLGQHVREAGGDVEEGEVLLEVGTVLGPRHLGLLASLGLVDVVVRPRPRVAIVSTGTELREPGTELSEPGTIHEGNSYLLAAAVTRAGGVAQRVGIVPDDPAQLLAVVRGLASGPDAVDVVVSSGGISMGDFDVVKAALAPTGSVWFGGVAMQPGKPQGHGRVPGSDVPFYALPGNPVSSYLSFELFVRPVLRTMLDRTPRHRTPVQARLTRAVSSPAGRRQFLRAALSVAGDGRGVGEAVGHDVEPEVRPVGGPGSHLLGDLAVADCVIVVPEDATGLDAGIVVDVIRLDGDA